LSRHHRRAVDDKLALEARIATLRERYLSAVRSNDEPTKRLLDATFREELKPAFEQAAEAERAARAALQELPR
jgi:hypothetical protein